MKNFQFILDAFNSTDIINKIGIIIFGLGFLPLMAIILIDVITNGSNLL